MKIIINKDHVIKQQDNFKCGENIIHNPVDISDKFNDFFINVGPTLSKKIPSMNTSVTKYIARSEKSIYLTPTNEEEICRIMNNFRESSPGWDAIAAKTVKPIVPYISLPLVKIINLSMEEGVFPDELKIARVIPLYKSNDPMIFSHYRPVSVLPLFSKLFKKIMYDRLIAFFDKWSILYKYQFGFRNNHSTYMALIFLMDKIISALNDGDYVLGLFLDFSKAFDTINHNILFDKLEFYGIRGNALWWLQSYLTDRYQYVEYNGVASSQKKILCGVPQGSILGPLLFLVYINDLPLVSQKLFPLMFADDTNIFIQGKDISQIQNDMNEEMIKISAWLKINKLSLNIDKTHFMLFKGKRKIRKGIEIKIDNRMINQVSETKFLGIYIDENLSWKSHIQNITKKVARATGILYKVRRILDTNTLRNLYFTFVYPYLTYCVHVWGNACKTYLTKLGKLQDKIMRIITYSTYKAHSDPLYNALKLLKIKDIHKLSIGIFMFKYINSELPDIFISMFRYRHQVYNYNTRQSHHLHLKKFKTNLGLKSVKYYGASLWNSIHDDFVQLQTTNSFKRKYKDFLLNNETGVLCLP